MKHAAFKIKLVCFLFITFFGLAVIIGSGSDDDDNDSPETTVLTYTGKTSQMSISEDNAEDVTTAAYEGYVVLGDNTDVSDDLGDLTGGVLRQASALLTKQRSGLCGGTRTLTITSYIPTVSAAATLLFDEFCNYGVIIDGSISASITFDGSTTDISFSSDKILLKDTQTEYVYQITDFLLNVSHDSTTTEVAFSGNFYDPMEGYVSVETTDGSPFVFEDGNEYPSSGQMVVTGTADISARLTALSSTTYQVEVDTNGDGDYTDLADYSSGTLTW